MKVKKFNGKPYGAVFTASEKKAMDMEINRQILKKDEEYRANIDALVLYVLMEHYGWRKKRLRKFWNAFVQEHKALREYYQWYTPEDNVWLAHYKLKQIGVDIHQWYKEDEAND